MTAADYFAPDYVAARGRFRRLATLCRAIQSEHPIAAPGPGGVVLTLDTAYVGAADPATLVVISSGIHGVEGFAGSALQQLFLDEFAASWPRDGHGVLLIHAINPYGFAFVRRANENNVDLNRNALGNFPGPVNPAYVEIDRWLNPPSAPGVLDMFYLQGIWQVLRKGMPAVKQAIAGGQYEFPQGIFYGGRKREQSIAIVELILRQERYARAQQVLHLDLHTGLGPSGTYKLLVEFERASDAYRTLQASFGAVAVEPNDPQDTVAYHATGLLSELTIRLFPAARVYPAVLEFGTHPIGKMIHMLCQENRLHFYGNPGSPTGMAMKRRFLETFCPRSATWREQLIANGRQIFRQLRENWLPQREAA